MAGKMIRLNKYLAGKKFPGTDNPVGSGSSSLAGGKIVAYFPAVVGSPSQVLAGIATHSSIQQCVNEVAPGTPILWLPGTYTENLLLNKNLFIQAQGWGVQLVGQLTVATVAYSTLEGCRIVGDISLLSSSTGNKIAVWQAAGFTFNDAGDSNDFAIIVES